jgi:methyltransferase
MLALLITFVVLIALQRVLELLLSRRHERALRAKGAYERGVGHYPVIVGLHAGWLVSTLVEGWVWGAELSILWPFWLALFVGGQALRYWAILSLGERWTTRVVILPGVPLAGRRPYKHVQHPNYLAVALEIFSAPLIFGVSFTALAFTLLNLWVLLLRIRTEARALREVNRTC